MSSQPPTATPAGEGSKPPQRQRFTGLRTRLLLLVACSIVPAILLLVWAAFEQRRTAQSEGRASARRLARLASLAQQQHIESGRQMLTMLSQLDPVRRGDTQACNIIFSNLLRLYPIYSNIGAFAPDGNLMASGLSRRRGRFNASDRAYFTRAVETRKFAVGEYQISRMTHLPTLNMGYPVYDDETDQLKLVAFAALDLKWLHHIAARSELPEGSTVTVIDRKGVVLVRYPHGPAGPRGRWVGESVLDRPGIQPFLNANTEFSGLWRGFDPVERLYTSLPLNRTDGIADAHVFVGIPTQVAFAAANRNLWQNIFFLLLVALLALAAAWIGSDYFVLRQLRSLLDATKRISAGNLSARTGVAPSPGELNQLARAFDEMADSLEQRVAERERAQAELKQLNQNLEQRVTDRTLELKRSNEDLEQFAYVASHDLQEPLRMVTSYVQLLRDRYKGKLDKSAEDFVGFALDGATRMQRLINDLLAYSRVHTRGEPFETVDCEEILSRVLLNLKVAVAESGAEVTHDPLPELRGDPMQLTQLFQNLIANAIKFHGADRPRVQISAELADAPPPEDAAAQPPAAAPAREWVFRIRDNGIGIAPEDFQRIFIVFQRLHARDKFPGTGIGLSVCKKIVERHGGRIWLESKPGDGTTFYFTLPA